MYTSRGNNAYGQQSYAGQSAYGQNVSLHTNLHCNFAVFIDIRIGSVSDLDVLYIVVVRIFVGDVFVYES